MSDKLKDYKKIYEDQLFKTAIIGAARIEAETVLKQSAQEPKSPESKAINRAFQRAILKRDLKNSSKALYRGSKKVSLFFVLFFLVSSFAVVNVEAVNTAFVEWVMKFNPRYTEIRAPYTEDNYGPRDYGLLDFVKVGYVPDGFEADFVFFDKNKFNINFSDNFNNGYFDLNIERTDNLTLRIDSEAVDFFTETIIHNSNGYITLKNEEYTIFWQEDNLLIRITSNISEEELLKIANGLKL